jgi:predicted ATPase
MSFIRSFSINATRQQPFPYNIPAVRFAKEISLDQKLTIFVGDNGSGKSTLLESIAYAVNLPLLSGFIGQEKKQEDFKAARDLRSFVNIDWKNETARGFFFRAEDFSAFLDSVEKERTKIAMELFDLKGQVDESVIKQMSDNSNYSLYQMKKEYGENLFSFSHGEAYMQILHSKIQGKGIYLLDEPEAALSPLRQLSLIAFILEFLKTHKAQFIIATHSPILMGIPGAILYEIQDDAMKKVEFDETEHCRITKAFLDNPEVYLRHLQ